MCLILLAIYTRSGWYAPRINAVWQRYRQAIQAAQDSPVKYDMIALCLAQFASLDKIHSLTSRLLEQIQAWMAMQPDTNRHDGQERITAAEKRP